MTQMTTAMLEMIFDPTMNKIFLESEPPAGHHGALRVYLAGSKKAVIDRDTDILTKEEERVYHREILAAVREELEIWIKHACFKRRQRRGARNVMDSRFVYKWKWVKSKSDPSVKVRIIRARLCLRGFKDLDADDLATFAATASSNSFMQASLSESFSLSFSR